MIRLTIDTSPSIAMCSCSSSTISVLAFCQRGLVQIDQLPATEATGQSCPD